MLICHKFSIRMMIIGYILLLTNPAHFPHLPRWLLPTFVRKSRQNSPPSSCARWSFTCCGWLLRNDPFGARSFTLFSLFVKDMSSQMIPAKTGALPRLSRIGGRGRRSCRSCKRQGYRESQWSQVAPAARVTISLSAVNGSAAGSVGLRECDTLVWQSRQTTVRAGAGAGGDGGERRG